MGEGDQNFLTDAAVSVGNMFTSSKNKVVNSVVDTKNKVVNVVGTSKDKVVNMAIESKNKVGNFVTEKKNAASGLIGRKPIVEESKLGVEDEKKKIIISKMEAEGLNFYTFLNQVKKQTQAGIIALGTLLKTLEANYPTIAASDRNYLIKDCIIERTKVDYLKFEELITKNSKNLMPSVSQTL